MARKLTERKKRGRCEEEKFIIMTESNQLGAEPREENELNFLVRGKKKVFGD
jgi:hypothetical protein